MKVSVRRTEVVLILSTSPPVRSLLEDNFHYEKGKGEKKRIHFFPKSNLPTGIK